MSAAARASMQPQTAVPDNNVKLLDSTTELKLVAYASLNKFLQNFIDHVSPHADSFASLRMCFLLERCFLSVKTHLPRDLVIF